LDQPSNYKDSQLRSLDRHTQNDLLAKSTTLYVGFLQDVEPNNYLLPTRLVI